MELESILTELWPFEFSHFRQFFGIVGSEVCDILLLQFSMDCFETMHTCCGHNEDVHVDL